MNGHGKTKFATDCDGAVLAVVIALALVTCACDKPAPPAPPAQTVAVPQTAAQLTAEPDAGLYAQVSDEEWCPRAHEDITKIVAAMEATMKRAGTTNQAGYTPPDLERFVSLCEVLPLQMRKCLIVGYAARNREACQTQLDGLDEPQKAAYSELMGK